MLKKLVQIVVKDREMAAAAKARCDQLQYQMYATEIGVRYLESVDVYKAVSGWAKSAEGSLRQITVAEFDGVHKKLYAGLGIRVGKPKLVVRVKMDEFALIKWARENAPSLLTVDMETLEDLAIKGKLPPEVAEVAWEEGKVTATIPAKLEVQ